MLVGVSEEPYFFILKVGGLMCTKTLNPLKLEKEKVLRSFEMEVQVKDIV
jgi:hypothetical protein